MRLRLCAAPTNRRDPPPPRLRRGETRDEDRTFKEINAINEFYAINEINAINALQSGAVVIVVG
jgi:hypothetical protein